MDFVASTTSSCHAGTKTNAEVPHEIRLFFSMAVDALIILITEEQEKVEMFYNLPIIIYRQFHKTKK